MARQTIIGIMGPGKGASRQACRDAFVLGGLIAQHGWVTLTGGVDAGVMAAASCGAKKSGGVTIGIIPKLTSKISPSVDFAVMTDLGRVRNNINILTSDAILVCGMNPGTASEVAFAIQADKPVILVRVNSVTRKFFQSMGGKKVQIASEPVVVMKLLHEALKK